MRGWVGALALLLTGCGGGSDTPVVADNGGDVGARLEAAAVEQGLVADPGGGSLVGAWARETDRLCVVDGRAAGEQRIGIVSDYGAGQGCSGAGTVQRSGARLRIAIGRCRFVARLDGDQIRFPGGLPPACDALCRGRASLAGFEVDRQSESASEAATLRGRGGQRLCG